MTSQTSLQIELQFLDLVHSMHPHRRLLNKVQHGATILCIYMYSIRFGYSMDTAYTMILATSCYLTDPQGVFPSQKFNAGCADQGNMMSTNDKCCSSRIHPYTPILPGHLHESGIPNARVVQAAEGWDWITGQSLRRMMRIQNPAYIACIV